jgi:hypothetical protein
MMINVPNNSAPKEGAIPKHLAREEKSSEPNMLKYFFVTGIFFQFLFCLIDFFVQVTTGFNLAVTPSSEVKFQSGNENI